MTDSEPPDQLPSVDALQFRRAQPIVSGDAAAPRVCAACKQPIAGEYFQVQDHVICPLCAAKIQAGRQSQRSAPLFRAVIYGVGAAVAGCILYAIPLAMGFQIGIVALAVGYMVGKAIRHASYGAGGRAQQILAVALTYFAISTSFIPATIFIGMKHAVHGQSTAAAPDQTTTMRGTVSPVQAAGSFLVMAIVSPFLELGSSPVGGLISLFILFVGLQRAWALTAGHEIMVTGPYT
jgi:hypothetical protein